jgi:transcriptional regulator with XRE-family HTH domain
MGRPANRVQGFGGLVRRLRLDSGLTQADLAEAADLSAGFIARIELNQASPSAEVVARLARALGVPLTALAEQTRQTPPEVERAYRETPEAVLWFARLSSVERRRRAAEAKADAETSERDRIRRLARRIARGGW